MKQKIFLLKYFFASLGIVVGGPNNIGAPVSQHQLEDIYTPKILSGLPPRSLPQPPPPPQSSRLQPLLKPLFGTQSALPHAHGLPRSGQQKKSHPRCGIPNWCPDIPPHSRHTRVVENQDYTTKGTRVTDWRATATINTISLPPPQAPREWVNEEHPDHDGCRNKRLSPHYFIQASLELSSHKFEDTKDHYVYKGAFGFPKSDWERQDLDHESLATKRPVLRFKGTHARIYNMQNRPIYIVALSLIPVEGAFPGVLNTRTQKLDVGFKFYNQFERRELDGPHPSADTLIYRQGFTLEDNQRIEQGQAFEIMYGPERRDGQNIAFYDTHFYLADVLGCS
ncbi:hypothetical protein TWF173_007225 [Orbilia oligospora]|nr:hypothetical protein TWF173_007225 [Orbilia oligospora]